MGRQADTTETDLAERLIGRAAHAGLTLASGSVLELAAYVALLLRWNARMNLTALDGGDLGLDRLVIEPLLAVGRIPEGASTLVDIGSGGGSPAIPIKIARPALFVRMVEARSRKAAFLREAVRRLELEGVVVETCRYEELCERPELQETHDVLTVRGVRVDESAARCLERLVRAGGRLLFLGRAGVGAEDWSCWRGQGERRGGRRVETGSGGLVVVRKGVGRRGVDKQAGGMAGS